VLVASKGGAPRHPAWYTNLVADPTVHVQVKGEKFEARARVAAGDERARLWDVMAEIWPDYDEYVKRTDREIPVVVLDPVAE
jgi:proline iminopeptidase